MHVIKEESLRFTLKFCSMLACYKGGNSNQKGFKSDIGHGKYP